MHQSISAHQFKAVYEDLGYDIGRLGCIMLDIQPEDLEQRVRGVIAEDEVFVSDKPHSFSSGIVASNPHVTLLYGLLRSGQELEKHVMTVLEQGTVLPKTIQIEEVGYFDSHSQDERYFCIVAHVVVSPELASANERLKFLPHINTFPGYRAHMTLAYIKEDPAVRDRALETLNVILRGRILPVSGLNFGE